MPGKSIASLLRSRKESSRAQRWLRTNILLTAVLILSLAIPAVAGTGRDTTLTFLGAARTVGGSAILLQTEKTGILIDFGTPREGMTASGDNLPPVDPVAIDWVLLTHAHNDHAGRIPSLYRRGFRGRVVGTAATKDLAKLNLTASLNYGEDGEKAPFGSEDIDAMMRNYLSLPYGRRYRLSEDVTIRLQDAGHILGSAMIELWLHTGKHTSKIVFTGDVGSGTIPLLREPAFIEEGDFIVIEATYGLVRRANNNGLRPLDREIAATLAAGGSVLIPAFSMDRTQKILFTLGQMKRRGLLPETVPVFADSTLGRKVTNVYRRYGGYLHPEVQRELAQGHDPFRFPGLREVSGDEALLAHDRSGGAIFVTASGMLDHGNAPRHLDKMCENPNNLLAIVGWQAPGSLGAALLEGQRRIVIPRFTRAGIPGERPPGEKIEKEVRMRIKRFDVFSNHADACRLLTWLSRFPKTKQVFVVHGDGENTRRLAVKITQNLGFRAVAPEKDEVFHLDAVKDDRPLKKGAAPCAGLTEADTLAAED